VFDSFDPNHWHWWILSVGFLVLELFATGTFFLWLALAAGLVGLLLFLFEITAQVQLLLFGLGAIVSMVITRIYLSKNPVRSDHPQLNARGTEYVGRTFVVQDAIENGLGRIQVGDGSWRVEGPDCPAGTHVRVIAVEGTRLKVELIDHHPENTENYSPL
jgi:inner membrane protein